MTELTSFMLERLWEDGELVLFRGKRDAGLARVLVVAPALEQPVPETIARLRHAYSLATKVDPAWAVRASERNCGLALRSTWSLSLAELISKIAATVLIGLSTGLAPACEPEALRREVVE